MWRAGEFKSGSSRNREGQSIGRTQTGTRLQQRGHCPGEAPTAYRACMRLTWPGSSSKTWVFGDFYELLLTFLQFCFGVGLYRTSPYNCVCWVCGRWSCPQEGVGKWWALRSPPNQTILGLHESISVARTGLWVVIIINIIMDSAWKEDLGDCFLQVGNEMPLD